MVEIEERRKEERSRKEMRRGKKRKEEEKAEKKIIDVKKVAEEWEIWDEEEKVVKLEKEIKKLVLERFHK